MAAPLGSEDGVATSTSASLDTETYNTDIKDHIKINSPAELGGVNGNVSASLGPDLKPTSSDVGRQVTCDGTDSLVQTFSSYDSKNKSICILRNQFHYLILRLS